ncbi:MAG: hypothetical protein A2Z38_06015 [Planctomycetes bacterium RBG_19FT_COMBO_48_8]|nr:MAG: hypothetical protein A2Z38_06015 [Planctomycetes bacterium RBG_19FT_COMBO_48_8]
MTVSIHTNCSTVVIDDLCVIHRVSAAEDCCNWFSENAGWCKHTNFELDTHVPMIFSVPGRRIRCIGIRGPASFIGLSGV